ncbi:Rho guanine nucleotide exchange factor [Marasmius sp. AFHP31]|nr:Rho guanine nucleotide exchange factor [Marasmius sp. AFHP31]
MSTFFSNAPFFAISDSSFNRVQGDLYSYSSYVPAQEEKHTEFDDVCHHIGKQEIRGLHKPFVTHIQLRIVKRGEFYRIRDVSVAEGHQRFGWLLDIPNADIQKQISTVKLYGMEGDFTTVTYRGRDARAAFEEDFRNLRERSPGSPELYGVTIGTTPSLVFRQEPLGVQSQQALYTDPPDSLHPPDLAPTPVAQDDTSGTDPSKPFHSQPSPESDPVHTHSQTNPPENTAPQDHASHGSTSSPRPFSPAENQDSPRAAQDDTGSMHRFDSRSQEGDPVATQSYPSQNHKEERDGDVDVEMGDMSMNEDLMAHAQKFFEDEQKCRRVIQLKGDKAQRWLDLLQALMDNSEYPGPTRSNIFKVMLHLSKNSGMYPECLTIKNVEKLGEHPVAGGGFGDVWKGRVAERTVCLKIVRVFNASDLQHLVKAYMQEAIVWQQLRHPNLLPFVGMYYLGESQGQLCLVSPWMDRGNLVMYLKDTPKEHVDHYSLASDIASGLAYLHDRKIVHGDMKGVNVLITPEITACIADFGLSHVADSHALKLTTSVTSQSRGTTRWLAPELLIPKPSSVSTRQSDIYAYGCVCYEIFAGRVPFHDLIDGAVLLAVYVEKQQPSRPAELDDNAVWELMTSCWNYDPSNRPTATDLLNRIRLLQSSRIPGGEGNNIQSAPSWTSPDVDRIRSNVVYPPLDLDLLDSI